MDATKLGKASSYINNLLLARGLLRNAAPIPFSKLATEASVDSNASITLTAQVINLVHDLILRRDRDQDQQEAAAQSLRTLRAESQRLSVEVDRLSSTNKDLSRQLALQQATTRIAQAGSQAAENAAKILRDELAKTKVTLVQVRTQCANDVRKRDGQLERLKNHLNGQQRGTNKGIVGATCIISPSFAKVTGNSSARDEGQSPSIEDADYSLKQESTEFLTQLSQSLSDENDTLIALIRSSVTSLKELLGSPETESVRRSQQLSPDQIEPQDDGLVRALPTSYQALSKDLDFILHQLRDLLTNPSFAPIEEVHMREEEITRLREGWQEMAGRWKDAVELMQGWMQRMQNGGRTINIEELRKGLGLGEGLININEKALISDTSLLLGGNNYPRPTEDVAANEDSFAESADVAAVDESPSRAQDLNHRFVPPSSSPLSPPLRKVISKTAIQPTVSPTDRKASIGKENQEPAKGRNINEPTGSRRGDALIRKPKSHLPQSSQARLTNRAALSPRTGNTMRGKRKIDTPVITKDEIPHGQEDDVRQLTVSEKLDHAALEARRASGSSASTPMLSSSPVPEPPRMTSLEAKAEPVRVSPAKRSGLSGRPTRAKRRRKSTLTPEELEQLMGLRTETVQV